MSQDIFNDLFIVRNKSMSFQITEKDTVSGSRIGGNEPVFFSEQHIRELNLTNHLYFMTISNDLIKEIDTEFSIFIPKKIEDTLYPKHNILCIAHPFSNRKEGISSFSNSNIVGRKLVIGNLQEDIEEIEDEEEEESFFENVYGNKIGGNPSLLQEEDYYFSNLKTNNFDFIFQFDESSYQKGQVKGNKPFLNGIIYFYGKINNHKISNIIVGFWQKG